MKDSSRPDWHEYFYYDEESPSCLRWKHDRLSGKGAAVVRANDVAGSRRKDGTAWVVSLMRKKYLVHVVVWELFNGQVPDGMIVEHQDGDAMTNKISRLRVTSQAVNTRNRRPPKTSKSGISGVIQRLNSWTARWPDLEGKKHERWFSIARYGWDKAFELALQCREEAIQKLNQQGAGYTERHGYKEGFI